jgi:hypothetical protein
VSRALVVWAWTLLPWYEHPQLNTSDTSAESMKRNKARVSLTMLHQTSLAIAFCTCMCSKHAISEYVLSNCTDQG